MEQVLASFYVSQLEYILEEKKESFDLGVTANINKITGKNAGRGVFLTINSPNSVIFHALKSILEFIPPISNPNFVIIYEKLQAELSNEGNKIPYIRSLELLNRMIESGNYLETELLEALKDTTLSEIDEFYSDKVFLGDIISLISGNINQTEAAEIAEFLANWNSDRGAADFEKVTQVNSPGHFVYEENRNNSATHCVLNWYDLGPVTFPRLAAAKVLSQFFSYSVFDQLRNKQQLGYLATGWVGESRGKLNLVVVVQGAYLPPVEMERKIEEFLQGFTGEIEEMSEEEIENAKDSVEKELIMRPESMQNWHYQAFASILEGEDVALRSKLKSHVQRVTKADFRSLFTEVLTSNFSLSIQISGQGLNSTSEHSNRTLITDLDFFRN